jgi:membrane protein implicated in regulation of membrane protease activity
VIATLIILAYIIIGSFVARSYYVWALDEQVDRSAEQFVSVIIWIVWPLAVVAVVGYELVAYALRNTVFRPTPAERRQQKEAEALHERKAAIDAAYRVDPSLLSDDDISWRIDNSDRSTQAQYLRLLTKRRQPC